MEPLLLGVDLGTSSVKGVLVAASGELIAKAERTHSVSMPRAGWMEHDAEEVWWQGFVTVVRDLLQTTGVDSRRIAGVGCSAIGPCIVPVDEAGRPLRPAILYGVDGRASREIELMKGRLKEGEALVVTANPITTQSVLPKAMWIMANEPEVYRRTYLFLDAPGYIVFRLTGVPSLDLFSAATGGLVDIHTLSKSPRMFAAAGVNQGLFPEPAWPSTVVGTVTEEGARTSGLAPGTPVVSGTCDAAAESLGAGMTDEGEVTLIYGTTAVVLICAGRPVANPTLFGGPYCLPGRYVLGGATAAAGALTSWYRDNFGAAAVREAAESGRNAYEVLYEKGSKVPPGSEGLVVLPYFSGARTPLNDGQARGVILGLTLRHTGYHLYRALLESVGYEVRHHFEAMRDSGVVARSVRAVGGGTRNPLWTQVVSDITGLSQVCVSNPMGAPLGAAYLAGLGVGAVEGVEPLKHAWVRVQRTVWPDPANRVTYERLYRVYREAYAATRRLCHALARESATV